MVKRQMWTISCFIKWLARRPRQWNGSVICVTSVNVKFDQLVDYYHDGLHLGKAFIFADQENNRKAKTCVKTD